MTPDDQSTFYKFMRDIFAEEWPFAPPLTPDQLSRWFKALELVDFTRIKKAFAEYLCDARQGKSPPKEGQIREIIKTIPFDTRAVRCTWENCSGVGNEIFGDYFYCRDHYDEMILKTEPDSPSAINIKLAREYAAENKRLGISSYEAFKRACPKLFNAIQKMNNDNKVKVAERNIIRAVGDFYETDLKNEDREKIMEKIKDTVRYYKLKEEK